MKLGKVSYPCFKRKREYQENFYIGASQLKLFRKEKREDKNPHRGQKG
ncbi:hypothetical protein HAL07_14190 [Helicobacter ailurogastricus]|uniref:Uncharacterized protein n=1 Tax=Helicobacter ailurogastricus TaxID=1578720 RepID=A0A0K2Y503_9HELI|nr:hypothetical protein HAL07_14190 [Helicobacter ailurogastricus]